jgi:hypothetical protein
MILVDEKTRLPLKLGQMVKTFRGENAKFIGATLPTRPNSTGRVYLLIDGRETGYYPGVIGAKWIKNGPLPSAED